MEYEHEAEYLKKDGTLIKAGLRHNKDNNTLEAWDLETGELAESVPAPAGFGVPIEPQVVKSVGQQVEEAVAAKLKQLGIE